MMISGGPRRGPSPRNTEGLRRSIVAKRNKKKKTSGKKKSAKPAVTEAPETGDAPEDAELEAVEGEAFPDETEDGTQAAEGTGDPKLTEDDGKGQGAGAPVEEAVIEEAEIAGAGDDEGEPLQTDEPIDEESADVVSADPAAQLLEHGELHAVLEALLFTSPDPLSLRKLSNALGEVATQDVRTALTELAAEYEEQGRGFRLIEVAGGYQMATQERFAEYILRLGTKKKQSTLSGAMLETLAIIAYRQPVIRAVVESIRGVETSGVVRNLLDLGLIEVVGRKEVIGRPQMYGTTEKFLRSFGLRNLKDLPSIRGLREKLEAEEVEELRKEKESREAKAAAPLEDDETDEGVTEAPDEAVAEGEAGEVDPESDDEANDDDQAPDPDEPDDEDDNDEDEWDPDDDDDDDEEEDPEDELDEEDQGNLDDDEDA